jgi:hypothetical protein
MKDIAKLNDDLRTTIRKTIEDFEKENGVEFTGMKVYPYFCYPTQTREIHIALGIKETENGQG